MLVVTYNLRQLRLCNDKTCSDKSCPTIEGSRTLCLYTRAQFFADVVHFEKANPNAMLCVFVVMKDDDVPMTKTLSSVVIVEENDVL